MFFAVVAQILRLLLDLFSGALSGSGASTSR
jgi:hypothetical protein